MGDPTWSEDSGLSRKTKMALGKAECVDEGTIVLLHEEDISRLLGQSEITLGQARVLAVAIQKLVEPPAGPGTVQEETHGRSRPC